MARAVCDRSAQEALRTDRHDGGEDHWSESLIRVKEHRAREPADVRREEKINEPAYAATHEPQRAAIETRVDELEQQFGAVSGSQRYERLCERLFEAEESVAQYVEDGDGDRKTPQSSQTIRSIANLICSH